MYTCGRVLQQLLMLIRNAPDRPNGYDEEGEAGGAGAHDAFGFDRLRQIGGGLLGSFPMLGGDDYDPREL